MSDDERDDKDSIAAVKTLAKSQRLRAVLAALAPYALPVLAAAGAWAVKSWRTDEQFVELRASLARIEKAQADTNLRLAGFIIQEQRRAFAIGRQAAFASAGFQGGEPAKARREKLQWAQKYATAYDRLVLKDEVEPSVAYLTLFPPKDVELP